MLSVTRPARNCLKQSFRRFNAQTSPPLLISCAEAKTLLDDPNVRFIDIRPESLYDDSHIPGAAHVQDIFTYVGGSDEKGIQKIREDFGKNFRRAGINKHTRVIAYDVAYNEQRGASCRGWYILNLLGHENVSVLDGGFRAWESDESNPTCDELDYDFETGNFEPGWDPAMWADKQDVLRVIQGREDGVILDVRDQAEIDGEEEPGSGRPTGSLPNSIHVNWKSFMNIDETGMTQATLKDPHEVEDLMAEVGITKDDNIIVLCYKGCRASNAVMQLQRSGFSNVKNYFGSWQEWSRDLMMPVSKGMME